MMPALLRHLLPTCLILALVGLVWLNFQREPATLPDELAEFTLSERPQQNRYLFDYAGILNHYEESAHRYLERLASRFHIEAVIVSVPRLPEAHTVATLAVDLANHWEIGARHEGRGLLLLLVGEAKQVKLEVGYALEDVFTDAFSGYVGDLQLGPNYRSGDLGTGLIATMEMIEQRAQLKDQGTYTPMSIARADSELLAGGAGASRDLGHYAAAEPTATVFGTGPGARSPQEAWEIMLTQWAGGSSDTAVDVYTEMTRLAMGNPDRPDPRLLQSLEHWRNADYEVRQDGDHAVIWFGAIDGWENAPFLFCNTGEGWKFDVVWQRRLITMVENPKWQVMQGPYPYVGLMRDAWQSTGKDLPLGTDDLYRCAEDRRIAERIITLERALASDPEDATAIMELLRLSTITNRRPQIVQQLLRQAKQRVPDHPEPYKYSALYNVTAFFQYRSALEDTARFIELRPDDPFGHDLKGFLLYRLGKYEESIAALEQAVALDRNDGYAYGIMARDYALLARKAVGDRRAGYMTRALQMQQKARRVAAPDDQRQVWLDQWMRRRLKAQQS